MTLETEVRDQTLPPGYQLEDYRITAVLGQGGFGITYRATDETLQRDVAIKEYLPRQFAFRDGTRQVHPRSQADEELFEWGLSRFVDEARALALFRHPNIISVIRYIKRNGTAYLVMEFEEGTDLGEWAAGRDKPDESRLVGGILVPVLEGLAQVHDKGLLHRDIKPDNIFIRRDGTPVLIDFGAARPHGGQAASQLTSIISAGYSPFEQYGFGDQQGPWSDLYALAGTFYRLISGRPPADAIARTQGAAMEPATSVGAGRYSKPFLEVLDQALSLDISARPQSAREFLALLGVEPTAPPLDPDATIVNVARRDTPTGRPGRHRLLAAGGAVAMAAIAVVGYLLLGPGLDLSRVGGLDPAPPQEAPRPVQQQSEPEAPVEGDAVAGVPVDGAAQSTAGDEPEEPEADAGSEPAGPGQRRSDETTVEFGTNEPAAGEPDPLSEDRILAGLSVSPGVRAFRKDQLAGAMLQYTKIKESFDSCRAEGCAQFSRLLAELQKAQQPQSWQRAEAKGSVTVQNPRRLENEECPFLLEVVEQISIEGTSREQVRTYCTSNGFDRALQEAQEVVS